VNKVAILFFSYVFVTPALAQTQFWGPSPDTVQKVDAKVAMVTFTGFSCPTLKIGEFARNYGGFTDKNGRRMILGQLVRLDGHSDAKAGIHIVQHSMSIADGGCGVANVWFDADTLGLIQATWGGR
jgi:hypothetical protein